jgi:hypothetical protein
MHRHRFSPIVKSLWTLSVACVFLACAVAESRAAEPKLNQSKLSQPTSIELTPADSPEAVLRESYRRMQASDWVGAADTFDPAALKQYREMIAPLLEAGEDAGMLAMLFGTEATAGSLKAMSDQAFFAAMTASMMRTASSTLDGQEILGGVAEGPDRIHMVVRSKASAMGLSLTQMEVVTLNKTAQGWRLALSGKMEGMAKAMQALRGRPKSEPAP